MKYTNVYGLDVDLAEVAPASHSALTFDALTEVLSWTKGDADSCIVIISEEALTFKPFDGVTYTVGQYVSDLLGRVIYRGRGTEVSIVEYDTAMTVYYVYLFAFNGVQSTEVYNKTALTLVISEEEVILMEGSGNILMEDGSNILIE